ncbi:hypothetical protein LINPERPRIM_LOCUS17719 [Linum perenne]
MRMEKEATKNGFFQLFDWSAKSRKKLFSSKSDLPERSKQGKRSDGNLPMTRLRLTDDDEHVAGSSIGEYSCASSVTDDDGYGARPAGVVAKLMGLDSMPTSGFPEPNCNVFSDTQSLREASYHSSKQFAYRNEYHSMHSGDLLYREDGPPPRKLIESSRPRKAVSRPIEKFQTEMLPPRSAKSIPTTHHKLLSPIKRANFIPSNTPAHIMEEAAKIIESSPQPPAKPKMTGVGSSSAPLKVRNLKSKLEVTQRMPVSGSSAPRTRDVKEKVEPAQRTSRTAEAFRRPVESNAAKCLKGQPLNKSWNGPADSASSRVSHEHEEGSSSSSGQKNKGKSVSLAVQAKVNVQRREGLNLNVGRATVQQQREQSEDVTSQPFRSQTNFQKSSSAKRQSSPSAYGVLRQNSQKQNCSVDKEKSSSKPSNSSRKTNSVNPYGRPKPSGKSATSKYGARKSGTDEASCEKGIVKNTPRKKRSLDGNLQFDNSQAVLDNMLIDHPKGECDSANGKNLSWAEESKRKGGTDVVSFTFTTPLTRSTPGFGTPSRVTHNDNGVSIENRSKRLLLDTDTMKISSSVGYNVVGGNDLSALLEQKLRELTDAVESSSRNAINKAGSASNSSSMLQHITPKGKDQKVPYPEKLSSGYGANSFSPDPVAYRFQPMFQGVDAMEECSSNNKYDDAERLNYCRRPSPISVLDHSFSTESSCTLESMDYSSSTEGGKQCSSSIQAQEVLGLTFPKKKRHNHPDAETELLDSASSTSSRTVSLTHAYSINDKPSNWEVEYVKKVLVYLDMMFHDFAIGRCSNIVNPHLFSQLENCRNEPENRFDEARLAKKALFDCVSECLNLKCSRYIGGGYNAWAKGMTVMSRKDRLAEEVHKDIVTWRKMGDCMVDELVDKDMSSQYGNWLDYEADAFGVGAEIEDLILNSLIDELVTDIQPRTRLFTLGV